MPANISRGASALLLVAVSAVVTVACTKPLDPSFSASTISGPVPLTVEFTPVEKSESLDFSWDFGDARTSNERTPSHTYEDVGDFTVSLTVSRGGGSAATSRSQVRTEPGPAGWVVVEPRVSEVAPGDQVKFTAQAFDELGNPVSDAQFTWSADPDTGDIAPDGTFTARLGRGVYAEAITASFERLGKQGNGVASISFKEGEPVAIRVDPPNPEIVAGTRITFSATALDARGVPVQGGTMTFEALRSVDAIDNTGLFRVGTQATESETALVKVSMAIGGKTFEHIVRAVVQPGVLDKIVVEPPEATVPVKGALAFSAYGQDRFGNRIKLDETRWTLLNPDPGEIAPDGRFTAGTKAGDYSNNFLVAQGSKNKVSASASVRLFVTPGPPVSMSLDPVSDSVAAGAGSPFFAVINDEFGNEIAEEGAQVVWEALAGGRVTTNGVFIAGLTLGEFPDAIRATIRARTLGNQNDLVASASVHVRQRSSDTIAVEVQDADGGGVILVDLASAQLKPLAESLEGNSSTEFLPNWASDAAEVIFGKSDGGDPQVFAADFKTGAVRQLTNVQGGAVMGVASPDGKKLAFVAVEGETWQIYVADMPAKGESAGQVTLEQATRVNRQADKRHIVPLWSPDSSRLAYTIDYGETFSIAISALDGSPEQVVTEEGAHESAFGWSRDGQRIFAGRGLESGTMEIVAINSQNGTAEKLLDLPFGVLRAFVAPDESELAVIDSQVGMLWLVDVDGTGLRQALSADYQPSWVSWRPSALAAPAG